MAKIRQYKDFTLDLDNYDDSTGAYQVHMPPSDEWGAPALVNNNLNLSEIEMPLGDLQRKDIYIEDLIPLGRKLADRLLPIGTIRDNFKRAVKDASLDDGVRLRLLIRDVALAQIPWEYTYLPLKEGAEDDRTDFLVVNPKVSMVRIPPMEGKVHELSMADANRLILAGVMANPKATGFSELNLKAERRFIDNALKGFNVEGVTIEMEQFLEDATEEDLDAALLKKPDIFHFSGHGVFSGREDQGSILLVEDKTSLKPCYLRAKSFAKRVASASVRLAYLGACETSKLQDASAWTGVAQALIAEGVLAVIAMQYEIQDSKAIIFAKVFYENLLAGYTLDEAVSKGRQTVLDKSDDKGIEWGVPTLYLRAKGGVLFHELSGRDTGITKLRRAFLDILDFSVQQGGEIQKISVSIETKSGVINLSVGPFT